MSECVWKVEIGGLVDCPVHGRGYRWDHLYTIHSSARKPSRKGIGVKRHRPESKGVQEKLHITRPERLAHDGIDEMR